MLYTSGVDQKVTQFSYVKTSRISTNPSPLVSRASGRWVQSCSRRLHSHDVRALAIWPPYTPLPPSYQRHYSSDIAPILASGGLDMSVVVTPAALPTATLTGKVMNPLSTSTQATFEDAYHRRLAYTSGMASASAVHLARKARLVMCTREAGLTVWRVAKRKYRGEDADLDEEGPSTQDGGWERVLDMDLNVQTNIVTGAISDDGSWIAVADWYETKLFQITEEVSRLCSRALISLTSHHSRMETSSLNEYGTSPLPSKAPLRTYLLVPPLLLSRQIPQSLSSLRRNRLLCSLSTLAPQKVGRESYANSSSIASRTVT